MKWPWLVLSLVQFAILFLSPAFAEDFSSKIHFSSEPEIFPQSWLSSPVSARGKPLGDEEQFRSRRILRFALSKYPPVLVKQNLKAVYVMGSLHFSGIRASGTNSKDKIYIANSGKKRGFTDQWIERVFHSEFSSILLRNHSRRFPKKRWHATHQSDFRYGTTGVEAVKQNRIGMHFEQQLLEQGFLSLYGQSSLENDFNAYAGQLLLGEPRLWDAAEKTERVARKLKLTIEFFHELDSSLDPMFFRNLIDQ